MFFYRRTVKATILLVPLLGVSNIPLFYEPEEPGAIYMLGSAILQHSQVFDAKKFFKLTDFFSGNIYCSTLLLLKW